MENVRKKVGQNLRTLILAQYRTIELFCHENKIDKGWLSRILRGQIDPSFGKIVRLANALEVPLTDIYPGKKK